MINLGRPLGNPTTQELAATGGRWQEFGSNSIYWKSDVGPHQIGGAIRTKWGKTGWENGILGYPTTRENILPGGRFNHFQGGSIYWSQATGANMVRGWMRDRWAEQGWETGSLGYPKGDEYDYNGGVRQDFQGGKLELNVKPELDLDPNDTSATIGVDDPSNIYPGEIIGRIANITRTCGAWQGEYRICTKRGAGVTPGPTTPDYVLPDPTVLRAPQESPAPGEGTPPVPGEPGTEVPTTSVPPSESTTPTPAPSTTETCVTAPPTPTATTSPAPPTTPAAPTCAPATTDTTGTEVPAPEVPTTTSPATTPTAEPQALGVVPMSVTKPLRQQTDPIPNATQKSWCDDTAEDVRSERFYACSVSNTQFDAEINGDLNADGKMDVIGTAFAEVQIAMRTETKDPTATGVGSLQVKYLYPSGVFGPNGLFGDGAFSIRIIEPQAQPATFEAKYYNGSSRSRTSPYTPGTPIPMQPNQPAFLTIDQKFKNIAVNSAPVSSALNVDVQGVFETRLAFTTYLTATERFAYPQVRCDGGGGPVEGAGLRGIGCVLAAGRPILEMNAPGGIVRTQLMDHVLWAQNSGLPGNPNSGYALHRIYQSNPQRQENNKTACPQKASDPTLERPSGYQCDEYPFATSREGAAGGFNANYPRTHYWCQIFSRPTNVVNPLGYSICMVPGTQNSSGGGLMPPFHRKNRLLEGTDAYYVNAYHP